MIPRQARILRHVALGFAGLVPVGWAVAWAVFHTVPGQDWVVFHTAAELVRTGDVHTLADPHAFTDLLNWTHRAWFAGRLVFHPWVYPPVALLLAASFGWMYYPASLAAFLAGSLAALLAALWRWERGHGRVLLIVGVLLCPATAVTLGAGQLSFAVASVLLGGLALLPSEPFLAGAIFSLLLLKPQFALFVPVALLAGRDWRAIAGGLTGSVFLVAASLALAGPQPWVAWLHLVGGSDPALVGAVRQYDQSVHTCLVTLGAAPGGAALGQLLAALLAAACVWRVFARPASWRQRVVVLLCAAVFGAPHVGAYDNIMPATAAVLTLLDGLDRAWMRGEWGLAAGIWAATVLSPPALIALLGVAWLTDLSAVAPLLPAGLMVLVANKTSVSPREMPEASLSA